MKSLADLGYEYDKDGTLRSKDGNQFAFQDQMHYDAVADAVQAYITSEVESLMERRTIGDVPIFVSNLAAEKILVIIQGSGRVQPGVWGCAICINEVGGLVKGSMLPYIEKAHKENYGIIILNPNFPSNASAGKHHVVSAWHEIVMPLAQKKIPVDVVAHSNGGYCFLHLLREGEAVAQSVRRVAFTDSYHTYDQVESLSDVARDLFLRSINYVCSEDPFGQDVAEWVSLKRIKIATRVGCACISAQCKDHAMTNSAAMNDIFKWFSETSERKLTIPKAA